MLVTFKHAPVHTWEQTPAYREAVLGKNVTAKTDYSERHRNYKAQFDRVSRIASGDRVVRVAMMCGIGSSHEEAILTWEAFPRVLRMHLVDWYNPHIDSLRNALQQTGLFNTEIEVTIHHADLRDLNTVPAGSVDFAYANRLFEFYTDRPTDMKKILGGISTALAPGGTFYSFDYPAHAGDIFYRFVANLGLEKLDDRILRKR